MGCRYNKGNYCEAEVLCLTYSYPTPVKTAISSQKRNLALTNAKRDVWFYWADIGRGQDWWHEIELGVDSSDTALIIVSENWLVSEICQRELEYIRKTK